MPKTTKEIIQDAISKGIVYVEHSESGSIHSTIMSHPNYRTDNKWYSEDEVEQLRKELKEKFQNINNMSGNYANEKIDSVFAKVIKGG